MEPAVHYVRDLPIPDYEEWRDSEAHNWLHPNHGLLPDLHGMVSCRGGEFIGGVWDHFDFLTVFMFLQGDDESSTAFKEVGSVPRTYRWFVEEERLFCMDRIVPTPRKEDLDWDTKLLRIALMESVKVAFTYTLGNNLKNRHLFMAHELGKQQTQRR